MAPPARARKQQRVPQQLGQSLRAVSGPVIRSSSEEKACGQESDPDRQYGDGGERDCALQSDHRRSTPSEAPDSRSRLNGLARPVRAA
jgi:hypothetical protein